MRSLMQKKYRKHWPRVLIMGGIYFIGLCIGGYILTEKIGISCLLASLITPFLTIEYGKKYIEKIKRNSEKQFGEFMQLVLTSVSAGKSIEQAFSEVLEDNEKSFKLIRRELEILNRRTSMHFGFYDELIDFSAKTESRDIMNLAYAIKIAGIKGGNLPMIIRNSLAALRVKLETDNEISQTLALPRYNHKIITVMPFALVLMIKSISKDYIDVIYNTRAGFWVVICVTLAMLLAWLLGNALTNISFEFKGKDLGFLTAKKKKRTMRFELSEITERIAILLEAGVPLWNSFVLLTENSEKTRPLECELKRCVNEYITETGYFYEPEAALGNMAERINDSTISTFVSLIVQNSRKGSGELVPILRMQAVNQRTERRAIAKQLADEASTLMVLPSVIVLAAIMVLVAAPAIISFF